MMSLDNQSEPIVVAPTQPPRRRRLFLRLTLVLVALSLSWVLLGQPAVRKHQLKSACAGADRIVLAYRTPPELADMDDWTKGERVSFELVGSEKVRNFLATIEPRPSIPYLECNCSTVPIMEIAKEREVLASLTLHHGSALRWLDGKWRGDTRLSPISVKAMRAWIEREGGPELSQLEARLDAAWEQYQAAREAEWKAEEAASTRPAEHETETQD